MVRLKVLLVELSVALPLLFDLEVVVRLMVLLVELSVALPLLFDFEVLVRLMVLLVILRLVSVPLVRVVSPVFLILVVCYCLLLSVTDQVRTYRLLSVTDQVMTLRRLSVTDQVLVQGQRPPYSVKRGLVFVVQLMAVRVYWWLVAVLFGQLGLVRQ